MKQLFGSLLVLAMFVTSLISCESKENEKLEPASRSIVLKNFQETGVDIFIDELPQTRTAISESYYIAANIEGGYEFEGALDIEVLPDSETKYDLFQASETDLYAEFLGSFSVNDSLVVTNVIVGDTIVVESTERTLRKEGETFRQCVKREYFLMRDAYEGRILDDLACEFTGPICKILTLIASAYECTIYEQEVTPLD